MRFSINFIRPTDGSLLLTFDPYQTSATGGSSFTQKIARVLPHCMACVFIVIAAAVVFNRGRTIWHTWYGQFLDKRCKLAWFDCDQPCHRADEQAHHFNFVGNAIRFGA